MLLSRIRRMLTQLSQAEVAEDMNVPGYRLHGLKGELEGHYAIWVTGNYRITFRFENKNVLEVDYTDYH